jgi:DDE family transposase
MRATGDASRCRTIPKPRGREHCLGSEALPRCPKPIDHRRRGGSNRSRCRLWKVALQDLALHLGVPIHVCHFPPRTSKWNKIEHRMFYHITQNWRGRPLVSHEIVIQLIANTTTKTGLKIQAELDTGRYPTGIQVTDAELAAVDLKPPNFHGDWNYAILPTLIEKVIKLF